MKEGGAQVFRWWKEIVSTCKGTSLGARVGSMNFFFGMAKTIVKKKIDQGN